MTVIAEKARGGSARLWRITRWGGAVGLLLVPLIAMRFTREVNWTASDFLVFGAMLALALGAYEVFAARAGSAAYRVAAGLAVVGGFLLVWISLAVGIIGSENNPANWMYAAVLAIGILGASVSQFRAAGMARTMFAMTGAMIAIAVAAVGARLGVDGPIWPRDVIGVTGILGAIWLLSGLLFRSAER